MRALRVAGHDINAVMEVAPGADDDAVIEMAVHERRILLTEDGDFGQFVYAASAQTFGVVLLRFLLTPRTNLPALVLDMVAKHEKRLAGRFVVLERDGFASAGARLAKRHCKTGQWSA
jgi:predicted nuclease of predicted toxin-antitoxin system